MTHDPPFQATVRPTAPTVPSFDAHAAGDGDWTPDDLELAYQQALELAEQVAPEEPCGEVNPAVADSENRADSAAAIASDTSARPLASSGSGESSTPPAATEAPLTPVQILEALLFVGGRPLTVRQLADVLGGSLEAAQVEELLAGLNRMYADQARPYEVRLVSGGYRLELRPEFEKVRGRVFGQGPREVKLSQDALEVLAFVAYRQPVTKESLNETGKSGLPGLLRQLLRRELIAVERSDADADVQYRTTARFLELFGLRSLADLPRAESIARR